MDEITADQVRRKPGRPRRIIDAEVEIDIMPQATRDAIDANKPKMVPMLLKRNYRPLEDEDGKSNYEIVGHWTEPVRVRNVAGQIVEVEPAKFIEDKGHPPPTPGIGSHSTKLWAGTIAKFSREEAMQLRRMDLASVEID